MIISFKNLAKLFVLVIAVLLSFIVATPTHAQVGIPAGGVELDGYAWSSNIGWISMNCKTGGLTGNDICATSNYKATVSNTGIVTGYAWSSNIGWIRFGGLSDFPTAPGTMAVNARMTGTYPNLTFEGWVRACAGDNMNASCNVVVATSTPANGIVWTRHGAVSSPMKAQTRIAYGNGRYVSLGSSGTNIITSTNGISWTPSAGLTGPWTNLTFGNGLFVAVANSGANRIATSPDGLTWTTRVAPVNNAWQDVIFANGQFVAIACGAGTTCNTTAGTRIMTSPDGITWTSRTSPVSNWASIAYGGGQYVVLGTGVMTSPDGITWTSRTVPAANPGYLVYGNGRFVATIANGSPTTFGLLTSSDGITWTQSSVSGISPQSLTFFDPYFILPVWSANSAVHNSVYISTDGTSWVLQNFFNSGPVDNFRQFYGGVGGGNMVFSSSWTLDSYYTGVLATSTYTGTGWDGWISLRSTSAPTHSIVMSSTGASATSYAWGSAVVGWINFDDMFMVMPTAVLSGTGCNNIPVGGSSCNGTVTWNITNASSPNVINTSIVGAPPINGASDNNRSIQLRPFPGGNIIAARDNTTIIPPTITLTASCVAGADFSNGSTCQLTAVPAPVITLTTNRAIARTGDTVQVTWNISRALVAGETCTLTGPGLPATVTTSNSQLSSALRSKTRFTLTCTGAFATVRATTDVEIIPRASEV